MDAINQDKAKDHSKITQLLIEYENYKLNNADVPILDSLKSKNFKSFICENFTLNNISFHRYSQV